VKNEDVCSEVVKIMKIVGLSEEQIDIVRNDIRFIEVIDQPSIVQRTVVTMIMHNLFMNSESVVPSKIRLALTIGNTVESWLEDMRLVVIPYLSVNKDYFFKV
jgi:hypothetical protein